MRGLAIFMAVVLAAGTAFAATLVLQPGSEGKDSLVYVGSPSENYGTNPFIIRNKQNTIRGIVEFEGLKAIPKGSTVNSAELRLYNWANTINDTFGIYRITASWAEMTVTWSNQPAHFATAYASVMFGGVGYYKWDVKKLVQEWVSGTHADYGFKVIKGKEGPGTYPYVAASDHTTADWRPKLTVDYSGVAVAPTSFGKVKALFK